MTLHHYEAGKKIAALDPPFYGIIQAAMRKADDQNLLKLRVMWPDVWEDLQARYHAPGGQIDGS